MAASQRIMFVYGSKPDDLPWAISQAPAHTGVQMQIIHSMSAIDMTVFVTACLIDMTVFVTACLLWH
jgi:hypothetical protein